MATAAPEEGRKVVKVVFLALVMDLLAFTMPLPLFPRLIAWYLERETRQTSVAAAASGSLLSQLLSASHAWRSYLLSWSGASATLARASGKNWDVVLLGGAMGSLFSFCQCIISPWLGGLSDTYGRKPVLLVTMLGNIISAAIWLRSTTFSSYLLSRIVGGLSEGNVQLSTAIISDVTDSVSRPRSLALVGIAFSICFTLGPSIGAYFASRPLPLSNTTSWNVFAFPAAISLVLLVLETLYLLVKLPETRTWAKKGIVQAKEPKAKASVEDRLTRLKQLGRAHGMFLFFFSGAEFTLTFLTYDLFSYTNAQNGRLLSFIGILSASLQGRYVRPRMAKIGEVKMASTGIFSCVSALLLLALLPSVPPSMTTVTLYTAAACLAYTSATVVSCLTSAAAGQCDDDVGNEGDARLKRGVALGRYRSAGQLGRAIGPLLASSAYWLAGPQLAYSTLGICLLGVWIYVRGLAREVSRDAKTE